MGMMDSLNAECGVVKFMGDKGLVSSGRRGELNRLIVEFLNDHNLPVVKYNPRYKGNYDALNKNCSTVQEHFDKFHVWVSKRKNRQQQLVHV